MGNERERGCVRGFYVRKRNKERERERGMHERWNERDGEVQDMRKRER